MIFIACATCHVALRVTGDVTEVDLLVGQRSEYWPSGYKCHICGGSAAGCLTPEVSALALASLRVIDVNAQEAFAALNGLGVPDERTCCEEVVQPMFEQQGIKVKGRQFRGQSRYFVDELEFPDGTRMFFGASPQGAVVYRITKPHSYVEATEHNNV